MSDKGRGRSQPLYKHGTTFHFLKFIKIHNQISSNKTLINHTITSQEEL
ncbi:hypothetical protein SAMD00079811_64930 [Scytonema sp. HK-05]|nr:hypothetical protein SAMD00079811_64930 [Scytonema sp. HK-05]